MLNSQILCMWKSKTSCDVWKEKLGGFQMEPGAIKEAGLVHILSWGKHSLLDQPRAGAWAACRTNPLPCSDSPGNRSWFLKSVSATDTVKTLDGHLIWAFPSYLWKPPTFAPQWSTIWVVTQICVPWTAILRSQIYKLLWSQSNLVNTASWQF